ncbi:hypothetical protein Gogos_011639 [Gossypium gossypioides]|uniref:DUF7745 domain-containing protein n=2 Tax=Gossypium gossypioides TaxID=34282 RepID=A0A7J9BPY1_GOSGO|nr:hypothetical protein [Gossypium gossypioides]
MEKRFHDKVKDNTAVRIWSEKTQQEKGDSLMEGYMSELKVDLVPTVEKCIILLYCPRIQASKAYSRAANVPTFLKRLMSITRITLGHINDTVSDLFDRLDKRVTPIPVENVSYRVFSENYSLLKEFVATPRRDDISEEKWMAILQSLQDEDVEWRAPWMIPDEILYQYGDFDWVPVLRIWGTIEYAPLLVLR